MKKVRIDTAQAPAAIGPYSQAIKTHDFLFTSGQLGIDPATGKLVGDDIVSQATQALRNMEAILTEAGLSFKDVVKTTVFLVDIDDFKVTNEVYAEFFAGTEYPARSAVQVAKLPLGAQIEMECVAQFS